MSNPIDIRDVTESAWARSFARYVLPSLLVLLGSVCGLLLQDIRSQLAELSSTQRQQGVEIGAVNNAQQLLNAKLDNGVIWRITELERRLNHVEQVTKTP